MAGTAKKTARKATGNAAKTPARKPAKAAPMTETIKQLRRQRTAPLRTLTPEALAHALEAFEAGHLRQFAVLAQTVSERDDTLASVKPKREKATAHRDWHVLPYEEGDAAEAHQQVLEDFWRNVRATNAYDRNQKGGLARLIKQMMTAASFKYAVHHIVWKPEPGKLRAVFEFVPLEFFENTTGILRFIEDGVGTTGVDLVETDWMVTVGDGLMVACLALYLQKRYATQDLLAFSEKFSMPGILGKTSAAQGSPAGNAMLGAVQSFGQDYAAVVYGDDGTSKLELIQPDGSPTAMPMPAVIERADRKMATLYRGADLSTMSSKDGEGTGASLQSEETDLLEADDCLTISETLREVERTVIEWHFGKGVEPLARIEIQTPVREDKTLILASLKFLVDYGAFVSLQEAADRLGINLAKLLDSGAPGEPVLKVPAVAPAAGAPPVKVPLANARTAMDADVQSVRAGLAADLRPLGEALANALAAGDYATMRAALKKISARAPDFIAGNAAADALGLALAGALIQPNPDDS